MALSVKNWNEFQHFKNQFTPWIKTYRRLTWDEEYYKLSGEAAKYLILIWLCADEKGKLPEVSKLAFRLHLEPDKLKELLQELGHYIISDEHSDYIEPILPEHKDDIDRISTLNRVNEPEERRTDKRKGNKKIIKKDIPGTFPNENSREGFEAFWNAFPMRRGKRRYKGKAIEKYLKLSTEEQGQLYLATLHYGQSEMALEGIGIMDPHRFIWSTSLKEAQWKDWITPEDKVIPKLKPSKFENSADANERTLHSVLDQLKPNQEDDHGERPREIGEGGQVIDLPSPHAGICNPRTTA